MEPYEPTARVSGVMELEEYYLQAYPRLVSYLVAVHGDREGAQEAAQEAFVKLMPRWSKISRYHNPDAWLRRVAMHSSTSQWRRDRNRRHAQIAGQRVVEQRWEHEASVAATRLPLHSLPLRQREVLVLHYWLDMPVAAIAAELHIAEGTVKSRLARGRAALAQELTGTDSHGQH